MAAVPQRQLLRRPSQRGAQPSPDPLGVGASAACGAAAGRAARDRPAPRCAVGLGRHERGGQGVLGPGGMGPPALWESSPPPAFPGAAHARAAAGGNEPNGPGVYPNVSGPAAAVHAPRSRFGGRPASLAAGAGGGSPAGGVYAAGIVRVAGTAGGKRAARARAHRAAAGAGADAGGGAAGSAADLPAGPGGANRAHRVVPDGPVHLGRPENPRPRARAPCYPQSRTVVGTQPSIWIRSERRAESQQVLIASRPPGPDRGSAAPPSLPRIKQAGVWTPSVFYSVRAWIRDSERSTGMRSSRWGQMTAALGLCLLGLP